MPDRIRTTALAVPALLLGSLLSLQAAAETAQSATDDATLAGSAAAIRAHVDFLADDLLEGRGTGSRGYDIAASYVATQLAALGIEPAGDNGGWLQVVPMVEATPVVPAAKLVLERDGKRVELEYATDFLPGVNYYAASSEVTAPLVFVGYGIHAPDLGHDDLAGLDLNGKIAVYLSGAPSTFPHSQRAHFSSGRTKMQELTKRGIVGAIGMNTPDEEKRYGWQRNVQSAWVPRSRAVDENGTPLDWFPQLKATMSFNLASAEKLFAGSPKPLAQILADAAAGKAQGFDLPTTASLKVQTALKQLQSANVVGKLRGSDPVLANEHLVFTAHLDHIGKGAAINGDTIYNGAFDNATGIGVMLEAARNLVAGERPKRSIIFLAVTAEERGLIGSDWFAQRPTVPKASLVANVNMDMPVMMWPVAGFTAFGAEHSTLGAVAAKAVAAEGLRLEPDSQPEEVIFVRSDQYSFVRQGIPAIYLDNGMSSTDPTIDVAARTKAFLRTQYHMPSDEKSLPIHYPSLARLARVNAEIGRLVGNDPARPTWLPGDFFGQVFGTPLTRAR